MTPAKTSSDSNSINRRFGPEFHDDGTVTFRVWAPHLEALAIKLVDSEISSAMVRDENGFFPARIRASKGMMYLNAE